ncbi:MAG: diaminopimelate decarboxylase [Rhodothermales bacterium]|nr:diaminopimelate decarboxylase [Rhodothermales bacterium]
MQSRLPAPADFLHDIASRFGDPTYVYFESVVRDRITRLRSALEALPHRLLYAMKANHAPSILSIMLDEGLGIDAVSPAELMLAMEIGFPSERIFYTANNMSDDEMTLARERGAVLNIGELSRLERFGRTFPGSDVSVRINPTVGAGHHSHVVTAGSDSKFGVPLEALDQIKETAERYDLRIIGLHQHIGSGILDTRKLHQAMEVILSTAERFEHLRFLNVGGGLGVPYRPDDAPLDLDRFRELIVEPLLSFRERHPADALTFWFEPGRFLTAESGVLLARVTTLKSSGGRTFAGLDTGMNHLLRPALYGSYHHVVNCSNPDGAVQTYDVVGNICESADFFGRDRAVAEIREGDVLAICDAGAYGISMASTYNLRPLPAEVFVDAENGEARLIRPRQSSADLVREIMAHFSGVPSRRTR